MLRLTRLSLLLAWFVMLINSALPVNAARSASLPYHELNRPDRGPVYAIAWSPDGKQIAVGTEQGLWLYNTTWQDIGHNADAPIHALAWSPDGKTIAAGYFGKQSDTDTTIKGGGLKLWTVRGGTIHSGNQLTPDGSVYALRFSPDGGQLAALSQMESTFPFAADVSSHEYGLDLFTLYDIATGKTVVSLDNLATFAVQTKAITQSANNLAWSHSGRYVAFALKHVDDTTIGGTQGLTIFDTKSNQPIEIGVDDHPDTPLTVDWNSSDTLLAIGGRSQYSRDLNDSQIVAFAPNGEPNPDTALVGALTIPADPNAADGADQSPINVQSLTWQPKGKLIADARGRVIRLWDSTTRQPVAMLDSALDDVTMLAWSPDGSQLLSAGSDYHVRLWAQLTDYIALTLKPGQPIMLPFIVEPSAISPDRRLAAVKLPNPAADGSQFVIADLTTGKTIHALQWPPPDTMPVDPTDALGHFVWSANGQFIASQAPTQLDISLENEQTAVWSASTGELIQGGYTWGHFVSSPDGKTVAIIAPSTTPQGNTTVEIHDFKTNKLLTSVPVVLVSDFVIAQSYLQTAQWSSDGRLIAIEENQPGGTMGNASVHLIDATTNRVVETIAPPKPYYAGTGDNVYSLGLGGDGKGGYTILVANETVQLAHLTWKGTTLAMTPVWTRPITFDNTDFPLPGALSNDGRYAVVKDVVLDANTGWPLQKLPAGIADYVWSADHLIGLTPDLQAQTTQIESWSVNALH